MKVKIIEADILSCTAKYIAHQVNCRSKLSKGLSYDLFQKYPYANVYADGTKRVPGNIIIRGNGEDERFVINMAAQYYPSKPKQHDTSEARLKWFRECLVQIRYTIKDLESIAFPYKIGCGLAGGDWNKYLQLLEEFAQNTDAEVYVCKL